MQILSDNFPIILIFLMKITCFLLGYLTIRLGYKLISNGIEGKFKFSADYKGIKGGLISSSPGLLFVLLGVLLIGYAIYVEKTYSGTTITGTSHTSFKPPIPPKIDSIP